MISDKKKIWKSIIFAALALVPVGLVFASHIGRSTVFRLSNGSDVLYHESGTTNYFVKNRLGYSVPGPAKTSAEWSAFYDYVARTANISFYTTEDPSDSGSTGCFLANEKVLTPYGERAISQIRMGDRVVSYDETVNAFTVSTVGRVIVHDGRIDPLNDFAKAPLIELVVDMNGKKIATKVTENHPYFDPIAKTYKSIGYFDIGDLVKMQNGDGTIVSKGVLIDEKSSKSCPPGLSGDRLSGFWSG